MNYTVHIHPELIEVTGAASPSAAARIAIHEAVAAGLEPTPAPPQPRRRASLYLDRSTDAHVRANTPEGESVSATIRDLLWTWQRHTPGAGDAAPAANDDHDSAGADATDDVLPAEFSKQQHELFDGGARAIAGNGVALLEGSTGVGKSRVIAALARNALEEGRTPVVVAAPTVSVITQLIAEWRACYGGLNAKTGVILGRGQFIDPDHLEAMLSGEGGGWRPDAATEQAIREWMDNGARPISEAGRMIASVEPATAWLAADLRAIAPDAPVGSLALENIADADNPAEKAYQAMGGSNDVTLVWTTQASVAVSFRQEFGDQGGRVPVAGCLLVDEAHQLESAFASQNNVRISPWGLQHVVQRHDPTLRAARARTDGRTLSKAARELDRVLDSDRADFSWSPGRGGDGGASDDKLSRFRDTAADACRTIADKVAETDPKLAAYFGRRAFALDRITGRHADSAKVVSSSHRAYRSLEIGPATVRKPLERLWAQTGSAVCLSGTLYVTDINGRPSSGYMAGRLSIPRDRLMGSRPVIADFVTRDPTLFLPTPERGEALCPPCRAAEDKDQAKLWAAYYDALADSIRHAASDALGGMLVICTQYADIAELANRLTDLSDRVIRQVPGTPLGAFRDRFERMDGQRPIWIGTGPVATGLDLANTAVAPANDTRLTDVLVVRIPFGWQTSTTRGAGKRQSVLAMQEAAMVFRQMIGRLIRRPGTPGRRLWVLDGRVVSKERKHVNATRLCRQVLRQYPNQKAW